MAFWLAICTMPDYLVLDEPVDGLDPVMRRQVWSLILNDVAERGTTVLVSSPQPARIGGRVRPRGHYGSRKSAAPALAGRTAGRHSESSDGAPPARTLALPEELEILHRSATGRVQTLIVRGSVEEVTARLSVLQPLLLEALPLSLEEIFIYELGGVDYASKTSCF